MLELDVIFACFVTVRSHIFFRYDIPFLAAVAVLLGGAAGAYAQTSAIPAAANGKAIYEQPCVQYHGAGGRGDGAAAPVLIPRPRDFTSAKYKLRTTETGSLPTDDDLIRTITHGVPGTSMTGWETWAWFANWTEEDRRAVVVYLRQIAPMAHKIPPPSDTASVTYDPAAIEEGSAVDAGTTP